MRRHLSTLVLLTGAGCQAACHDSGMAHGFDGIEPSANLTWQPCFDDFTCSKLEVPLDYANRSLGTTSIAFIKLAGKNATSESPNIVLIPGGPGNSGVDLLITSKAFAGQAFGEQYNIVSFDPRGVNHSGLAVDCFSGNTKARSAFSRLHNTGVANISSPSFGEHYYSSSIYGEWCNDAVRNKSPYSYYVTTPAVAHDLLTFVEAEAELAGQSPSDAKFWGYGASYGTVIGATFASMFPERVERLVLDGTVNAEGYYTNDPSSNLDQSDKAIEMFATFCHSAGRQRCSFWGPTPADIMTRLDNILHQLQTHPVPISRVESRDLPTLVTYSDLKAVLVQALYNPVSSFPMMADALHQVEKGNVSAFAGMYQGLLIKSDAGHIIQCADSYRTNILSNFENYKETIEHTTSLSRYVGDTWPVFVDNILCRSIRPQLPDSLVVASPKVGLEKPTPFPILFGSNTIDPITPLKSARTMSSRFPGSVLLQQEAIGHTVINLGGSNCYFAHVQAYFQGIIPPSNITCPRQYTPFIDTSPL
ncbi:Alpha/Beta hydrolase protein [Astrocystis sublimbata]|nr:Alpha/Beta hydrolase protein [Astrocystis sublimbata]